MKILNGGNGMRYNLSDNTWNQDEVNAAKRVLDSGYFTMGKEVEEYEKEFAAKMGTKYAVMSNSGSSANLLAIAALCYSGKLAAGDEVIVPAVSWSTTYFPLSQYQLRLKFVDIDRKTLNIDIKQLKNAITQETKAFFCVNLLGNPNDYLFIKKLCDSNGIILVEDNCESLGGTFENRYLGTFGCLGTFSTFYSHHLCTMEGGVTVTDDEELYYHMLCIRAHGWTRNLPSDNSIYKKSVDSFYESFNFIMPGYNLRPLEIEAAIGKEQLRKMDLIISQRRKNAKYFADRMQRLKKFDIQHEVGKSSWFGFAVILTDDLIGKRDLVVSRLRENNIEVRPIVAGNFTKSPATRFMDYSIYGKLENADYIHENGFFVGNHCEENDLLIDMLVSILEEIESE